MKWFGGDIPTAIKLAKDNKAIFIVYISGQDDVSKEMEATWANAEVSSLCEENGCVALRLQANSDTCAQFSMIYPVVCVPSTFFIGENGVPLEVTGGSVKPSDFVQKIKQVLQLHKAQFDCKQVGPLAEASSPKGEASAGATTPEGAAPSSSSTETAEASNELPSVGAQNTDTAAGSSKPLDEKIERVPSSPRARQLLAQKQAEKAEKAKEEERLKELERRKMGQEAVKLKQWQKEQHMKEEMEEWKKEKAEQKREKERILRELARDRAEKAAKYYAEKEAEKKPTNKHKVLEENKTTNIEETMQEGNDQLTEQLKLLRAERSAQYHQAAEEKEKKAKESEKRKAEAQSEAETKKQRGSEELTEQLIHDREEKKARFQAQKEERERASEELKQKKLEEEKSAREKSEAAKMEHARLQFRLPDGSAVTNQFSSQDTLQTARDFLSSKIGSSLGNFYLTTTYPKRRFQDEDLPKTLLDLGLAPSAVIVVIPDSRRTVSRRGDSNSSSLLMTLLAPLIIVWNFLYALVFGTASEPRGVYNPVTSETPTTASAPETSQHNQGRERPKSSYGLRRRQEGNIMRLSAVQDDDDDTATWNGNSTQQM